MSVVDEPCSKPEKRERCAHAENTEVNQCQKVHHEDRGSEYTFNESRLKHVVMDTSILICAVTTQDGKKMFVMKCARPGYGSRAGLKIKREIELLQNIGPHISNLSPYLTVPIVEYEAVLRGVSGWPTTPMNALLSTPSLCDALDLVTAIGSLAPEGSCSMLLIALEQLSSAVQKLHSFGVVHRDIKAENIFVSCSSPTSMASQTSSFAPLSTPKAKDRDDVAEALKCGGLKFTLADLDLSKTKADLDLCKDGVHFVGSPITAAWEILSACPLYDGTDDSPELQVTPIQVTNFTRMALEEFLLEENPIAQLWAEHLFLEATLKSDGLGADSVCIPCISMSTLKGDRQRRTFETNVLKTLNYAHALLVGKPPDKSNSGPFETMDHVKNEMFRFKHNDVEYVGLKLAFPRKIRGKNIFPHLKKADEYALAMTLWGLAFGSYPSRRALWLCSQGHSFPPDALMKIFVEMLLPQPSKRTSLDLAVEQIQLLCVS
jgi:serine/threonine protein kinase